MLQKTAPTGRRPGSKRRSLRLVAPPVQYHDVHGHRHAFRMAGEGTPVLLLHGLGDGSATWSDVLHLLSSRHRVIAPDLAGASESDIPRAEYSIAAYACGIRDLLSVLDIERVTVVGHSLGGAVAMQFAYQFPDRCERLVLVSSGGIGREVHPLLRVAACPGAEAVLPLATTAPVRKAFGLAGPLLRRVSGLGPGPDLRYILAQCQSLTTAAARQAFLRALRAGVDLSGQVITMLDRCYLAAGLPSLIIWGAHDHVIPVKHAAIAHAAMPGSRLKIFSAAGHFPHHDDPAGFSATVQSFIAETQPSPYDPERWRELLRGEARTPAPVTGQQHGSGAF